MFTAKIVVTVKESVLDPAGVAVQTALQRLQFNALQGVRVGKYIELQLDITDRAAAIAEVEAMCDKLLVNHVVESYRFELEEK
ncbi:MAG: phosphoribosylformylglycinamidine synthase subunit PurS [Enterobacteriaceae bacterium]